MPIGPMVPDNRRPPSRSWIMLRTSAVFLLTIAWCISLQSPTMGPPFTEPAPRMPASVACPDSWEPHGFDPALYQLATRARLTELTTADRAAIATDELAALRYLIQTARQPGRHNPLPLPGRSRSLLHVLNVLATVDRAADLPDGYLLSLYDGYGPDTALAMALALKQPQPPPILAQRAETDGAHMPALAHLQTCATLQSAPDLLSQCGQPVPRRRIPFMGHGYQERYWPPQTQRLPGCETDPELAERLLTRFKAALTAGRAIKPDWQQCFAGLSTYLTQRGDPRLSAQMLEAIGSSPHGADSPDGQAQQQWLSSTFEFALLALSPLTNGPPPRPTSVPHHVCHCPTFQAVTLSPFRTYGPPPPRAMRPMTAPGRQRSGCSTGLSP